MSRERYPIDVFVAHKSPDRDLADRLVTLLSSHVRVFWDGMLPPGERWTRTIPDRIRQSRYIVAIVTATRDEHSYYADELDLAIECEKSSGGRQQVIPVRWSEGAVLPFGLRTAQAVDATGQGGLDRAAEAIVTRVRGHDAARSASPGATRPASPSVSRSTAAQVGSARTRPAVRGARRSQVRSSASGRTRVARDGRQRTDRLGPEGSSSTATPATGVLSIIHEALVAPGTRAQRASALLGRLPDVLDPAEQGLLDAALRILELDASGRAAFEDHLHPACWRLPGELWCPIHRGTFLLGAPPGAAWALEREGPQHRVELHSGFEILSVPVTSALFAVLLGKRPSSPAFDPRLPAVGVSWPEARRACEVWSGITEHTIRLPAEAEWEYVCRAGSHTRYWSGDDEQAFLDVGWSFDNCDSLQPVATKPANPWGVHDMHGNLWEWCIDPWAETYAERVLNPRIEPDAIDWTGSDDENRVVRGGSFMDEAAISRATFRNGVPGSWREGARGFRVVRTSAADGAGEPLEA